MTKLDFIIFAKCVHMINLVFFIHWIGMSSIAGDLVVCLLYLY